MRWFLSRSVPPATRILLVESGPREVCQRLIPRLRAAMGEQTPIDLFTCLPDNPPALAADARVWRTLDVPDSGGRRALLKQMRAARHPVAAIICADDPILGPWKTVLLFALRAKFLIVNENADFFWLDRGNWRTVLQFLLTRAGLRDPLAARTLGRLVVFPLTLAFLLAFAARAHLGRVLRLARPGGGD